MEEMKPNQMKDMCQQNLYQFIQIETKDGNIYTGILHSYDEDQMFVIMPSSPQTAQTKTNDNRLFPFFGPFGLFGFPFFGLYRFGPFYPYWW